MNTAEKGIRNKLYGATTDLTPKEAECILNRLDEFENPQYLEIGVWYCGTFCSVLNHLEKNKESYRAVGIDLFESIADGSQTDQTHKLTNKWNILNVAYHEDMTNFLEERDYKNFSLLKGYSDKIVREEEFEMDVYFIDGNHAYEQTRKDAEACIKEASSGSYFIFHNASSDQDPDIQYIQRDGGPWKVCEELKKNTEVEFIEKADRCVVFRKV